MLFGFPANGKHRYTNNTLDGHHNNWRHIANLNFDDVDFD